MSNSLPTYGLYLGKLLCPGDSPCKNTRVGCHVLLQGIFPTRDRTRIYTYICVCVCVCACVCIIVIFQLPSHVSLSPHGLQLSRLPCLSPSPRSCSSSCPLSPWCHPIISSSVALVSFCLQSFPASGSFLTSQLFASGGQSIGTSISVLPKSI